jgi:hypothetical protein
MQKRVNNLAGLTASTATVEGVQDDLQGIQDDLKVGPLVLDQHGDHGPTRLERPPELAERLSGDARPIGPERTLGRTASLCGVETETEQRGDDAGGAVALQLDRHELTGIGIARHEERVENPYRTSTLDPLQRADEPALEVGVRSEPVDEELCRLSGHDAGVCPRPSG